MRPGSPTLTSSYNAAASSGCKRMQPCERNPWMLVGAFVPWMPMPARLSPIQWRPIGLSGPGGTEVSTGLRSARISAWIDGGTTQVLSIC